MEKYLLVEIGQITIADMIFIKMKKDYIKTIYGLKEYSHLHLFYCKDSHFYHSIVKIDSINEKTGTIYCSDACIEKDIYSLVDIKPYIPSEDVVNLREDTKKINISSVKKVEENYEMDKLGAICLNHNNIYLNFKEPLDIKAKYLKVFWWFSKFDSKTYRDVKECTPPYENAPRCGVLATRSPVRPNPLAMTIVKVLKIDNENKRVYINGIEAYDKTPFVGLESYCLNDKKNDVRVPDHLKYWPQEVDELTYVSKLTASNQLITTSLKKLLYPANQKRIIENTKQKGIKTNGIEIKGARENNLKGINVLIPYHKLTAVVGVSGSGKSSLVNDTIYQECHRKMEYLNHAKNIYSRPKVDEMTGCIPAVLIKQSPIKGNSLSTVGTYSNAYDYLRIIYAAIGIIHCPTCHKEIIPLNKDKIRQLLSSIKDYSLKSIDGRGIENNDVDSELNKNGAIILLYQNENIILQISKKCYHCNKIIFELTPQTFSYINADSRCPYCHGLGVVKEVDKARLVEHPERSLLDDACSFYGKLRNFITNPNANWMKGQVFGLAEFFDVDLNIAFKDLPKNFTDAFFDGLDKEVTFNFHNKKNGRIGTITRKAEGIVSIINRTYQENSSAHLEKYMKTVPCEACNGERLAEFGRFVTINDIRYPEIANKTFIGVSDFCKSLINTLSNQEYEIVKGPLTCLQEICTCANNLGIGYLPLNQITSTLSGGESQRLKYMGAFENHLSHILYIFDEPSKGLDPRDYKRLVDLFQQLIDEQNTILMVEHNEELIKKANYLIEIGPKAGTEGGTVVGAGTYQEMINNTDTQISHYINNRPIERADKDFNKTDFMYFNHLNHQNLKDISISIPKGALTCIYGVSGSGKTTLMKKELFPRLSNDEYFNEIINIDQTPIGKNCKSIVATYLSIMDEIRDMFTKNKYSIQHNLTKEYFSFNNKMGACSTCNGDGKIKVDFIEDSFITCPDCLGKRFNKDVLRVKLNDKSIDDVLSLSIDEATTYFANNKDIVMKLLVLKQVGLGYLKLGQATSTLSGGEASRLKIASRLMERKTTKNKEVLYLLDEPTTGLHFSDVENLLELIDYLIKDGATVIAIEHNRRFIAHADWKIELGPGAGHDGGNVIYMGK